MFGKSLQTKQDIKFATAFPQPSVASLTPLHFHLVHVPNWFRHLSNFKRFHLEATANPHLKSEQAPEALWMLHDVGPEVQKL